MLKGEKAIFLDQWQQQRLQRTLVVDHLQVVQIDLKRIEQQAFLGLQSVRIARDDEIESTHLDRHLGGLGLCVPSTQRATFRLVRTRCTAWTRDSEDTLSICKMKSTDQELGKSHRRISDVGKKEKTYSLDRLPGTHNSTPRSIQRRSGTSDEGEPRRSSGPFHSSRLRRHRDPFRTPYPCLYPSQARLARAQVFVDGN